jgi:Peptidase family C50
VHTMAAVDSAVLAAFASLSLSDSSLEHDSDAVRKVAAYVQHATESIASAACNATVLQKLVKTHAAQLQRIAQAGLKNRSHEASASLDLACQALYAMVQLGLGSHAPAAGASVPSLWRLLYQALARCVDLKCFEKGLQVSQALQRCISEKHAAVIDKENCVPAADSGACAFGAPPADCALDLAKLASGAIINTCNCCLGSGAEAVLARLVQSSQACDSSSCSSATAGAAVVGKGCEQWLDSVAAAGDVSTADSYRQQLFQLLWRAAALLEEKHSAALLALRCRCRALELHSSKQQGWDPAAYVSNVLRAGAAAERTLCSLTTTVKASASSTAKQRSKAGQSVKSSSTAAAAVVTVQDVLALYLSCYDCLCQKQQCKQWPLAIADSSSDTALVTVYIDWLLHYAAVHTRRGPAGTADASVLVQAAYDYVMSCGSSSCAVQRLLVHTYASVLALQAADLSSSASSEAESKTAQQRKLARRGAQQSLASVQLGLEHLGQCCDAAEALLSLTASTSTTAAAAAAAGETSDTAAVAAAVTALLKAWRTGHRAPATVERLLSTLSSSDAPSSAASLDMQPAAYAVLGDLSRALATLRARAVGCSSDSKQPLIAAALPLIDVAFDSYVKAAAAYAPLLEAEAAASSSGVSSSDMWNRAEQSLLTAEELITSDIVVRSSNSSNSNGSNSSSGSSSSDAAHQLYRRRLGAAWFSLGKAFVLHIRQQQHTSGAPPAQPLSSSTAVGISAMARGCQLLECWLQTAEQAVAAAAPHSDTCAAVSSDSDSCVHDELETALQTVKLDLRLSLLASYLRDCGEVELATAAARRAVGFCAALWRPDCCYNSIYSSSNCGDDAAAVLTAATPQIEAYTAPQLADGSSSSSAGKRSKAVKAMTAQLCSYLRSGISADVSGTSATVSLWHVLASRVDGALLHTGAAAAAVIEECQCYSAALWRAKTADALSACVTNHSSALEPLLQQGDAALASKRGSSSSGSSSSSSGSSSSSSSVLRRALLQAAQFAHELYCASIDMGCDDIVNSDNTATLAAGLQFADAALAQLIGATTATDLIQCAQLQCARGLLLRDSSDCSESNSAFIAALCALEQLCSIADGVYSASSCEAVVMTLQDHFAVQDEAQLRARVLAVCATLSQQQQQQQQQQRRQQQRRQQQREHGNDADCSSSSSSDSESSDDSHADSQTSISKQQQQQQLGHSVMMCEALLSTLDPAVAAVCKQLQSGLSLLHSSSESWPYTRAERVLVAAAEAAQALLTVVPAVKSSHAAAHLCVCAAHMALAALTEAQGQFGASLQHLHTGLQLCARRSRGHNSSSSTSSSSGSNVSSCHVVNFGSLNNASKFKCAAEDEHVVHEEGIGAASSSVTNELDAATAGCAASDRASTTGDRSSSSSENGILLQSKWLALYLDGVAAMGRLYIARGCPGKGSGYLKQWARLSEQAMADKRGRRSMVAQASLLRAEGRGERADTLLQRRRAMLPEHSLCSVCSASSTTTAAVAVAVQQSTKQQQRVYGSGKQSRSRATAKTRVTATATVTTVVTTAVSKSKVACSSVQCSCAGYWGGAVEQAELLCAEGDLHRSEHRFEQAAECYASGVNLLSSTHTASITTVNAGVGGLLAELKQRHGRAASLLGDAATAVQLYKKCLATAGASPLTCATALYRLSRACLDGVAISDDAKDDDVQQQQQPEQMLERALALASQSGAYKLLRRVKRLLAEVTITADSNSYCSDNTEEAATMMCVSDTWHTAALTSLSVGIALCNQMARKAARQSADGSCITDCAGVRLFAHCSGDYSNSSSSGSSSSSSSSSSSANGHSGAAVLQQAVTQSLPAEWTVISLCITPTGGLLLTRITRDHAPLTVNISMTAAQCSYDGDDTAAAAADNDSSVASVIGEWKHVLELNRQTLRGSTTTAGSTAAAAASDAAASTVDSSKGSNRAKAEWWAQRADVDTAIDTVMTRVQQQWFADSGIVAALLGAVADAAVSERLTAVWLQVRTMLQQCSGTSLSKAWLELVRVCVHGGDVMSVSDWQQLLAIAGCDTALAADIHSIVTAAFTCDNTTSSASHSSTADPRSSSSSSSRSSLDCSRNGLKAAAAAAVATVPTEAELTKLTVPQLKAQLQSHGVSITGVKRKADYVQLLLDTLQFAAAASDDAISDGDDDCSSDSSSNSGSDEQHHTDAKQSQQQQQQLHIARHPVILVLGEQLQSMPFEALPCLRGHPVTRLPALPFLFTALSATWSTRSSSSSSTITTVDSDDVDATSEATWSPAQQGIRLHSGFYVLDPEQNLPTSRATLQPALEALQRSRGWSGAVGSDATSSSFQLASALSQHDLFVYCGHGAGELLLGRDDVAALQKCAAAVIMGCSSGRLKSSGCFEPAGMVSGYLVAGSPAVVANLWDVTDRDIDRYCLALLRLFAEKDEPASLAHAVAQARSECKLKHVIGYAPVCYGIPVLSAVTTASKNSNSSSRSTSVKASSKSTSSSDSSSRKRR